jgi:hypothetical protein
VPGKSVRRRLRESTVPALAQIRASDYVPEFVRAVTPPTFHAHPHIQTHTHTHTHTHTPHYTIPLVPGVFRLSGKSVHNSSVAHRSFCCARCLAAAANVLRPRPLGVTKCRTITANSLATSLNAFWFVVGLMIVWRLVSISELTMTVFASYDIILRLVTVIRRKSGARRLVLWGIVTKVGRSQGTYAISVHDWLDD